MVNERLYKHPAWKDVAVRLVGKDENGLYHVVYYNIHPLRVAGAALNIGDDKLKIDNLEEWEVIEVE